MAIWVRVIEIFLLVILAVAIGGFLSFMNVYGAFLALVTAGILFGVFKRQRWGYFAAAAWGLGCYQLAKEGYEFADIKRWVMMAGPAVVVIAIVLHEKLARKPKKNSSSEADGE